jgi:hypothetical protein
MIEIAFKELVKLNLVGEYQDVIRACLSADVQIPPDLVQKIATEHRVDPTDIDWTTLKAWRKVLPDSDSIIQATDGSYRLRVAQTDPITGKVNRVRTIKAVME